MKNFIRYRLRYILIRLLAIFIGLSPLLFVEIGLRWTGWRNTDEIHDPYVGFSSVRPLFTLNDDASQYEISPSRYPLFQPDKFLTKKPANGFRIFCLGGSTVQGRPYSIETSFTNWLKINLQAAAPERHWEVVNCGGVSYASYRLVPILQEVLSYEPDLIVLYTGHNEFLEDRAYQAIKQRPAWLRAMHEWLSYLKTYQFFRSCFVDKLSEVSMTDDSRTTLPVDVEAELDFRHGLAFYHRDDAWRENVISHFDFNLNRMIRLARLADVPVILVNPVSNLSGTVPFKSEHGSEVPLDVRQQIEALGTPGAVSFSSAQQEASRLSELLGQDPVYAALHFRLGQCQLALGQSQDALKSFVRAKELDVCPLRILEPMHAIILRASRQWGVPLVDVQAYFAKTATDGIPGNDLLVDHVHPTIRSHQEIAELLVKKMEEFSWLQVSNSQWVAQRQQDYLDQLEALDFMYFKRGEDRLRGLQRWSRGEVQRQRAEE